MRGLMIITGIMGDGQIVHHELLCKLESKSEETLSGYTYYLDEDEQVNMPPVFPGIIKRVLSVKLIVEKPESEWTEDEIEDQEFLKSMYERDFYVETDN